MTLWRWCAVAGILSVLVALSFAAVPNISACGPGGVAGPWVDFQNVQSTADVERLIRADCAPRFIPALRTSMLLDAIAFIPAYLAFLISAALAVIKGATRLQQRVMKGAIGLAFFGAVADQVEGGVLLHILGQLPGTETSITLLVMVNFGKSLGLAAASALIGFALFERRSWTLVAGAVIGLSGIVSLLGRLSSATLAANALFVAWTALLLTALAFSFKKRVAT